ncbi:FliM/FliN family flagellar motor switch protein [Limnochorda pilosa]|uniref:Flagellar motor switch protein FliM n=1 Tax=Limnochorda pilosa TaxID=1555112 RepID=A0A0K2SK85_LIMPI|nr:FliM/FliN family flagellar motor switch protein [Limnochorda pilosa]BAS27510.1 hypothetical protein LIP_1664 [Limnochorda pilosa]
MSAPVPSARGAVSGDTAPGVAAQQPDGVRAYSFDLHGPLGEQEWKGLVRFQGELAEEWALVLTQWLKRRVRVRPAGPPVSLRRASSLWEQGEGEALRWHVDGAPVLLIWPQALLFQTLDCLLGGPGEAPSPLRPPTEIEGRVIRQITARLAYRLLRLEVQRLEVPVPPGEIEVHPVEPGQVSARSRWLSLALDVEWRSQRGPSGRGGERFYLLLSPEWAARARKGLALFGRGMAGEAEDLADLKRVRTTLQRHLEETPVTVRVVLGRSRLTLREVLSLEPGDVLQLEQRVDEPLPVEVGEAPFFLGRPGEAAGRMAVRLEAWVGGSSEPAEAGERGGPSGWPETS